MMICVKYSGSWEDLVFLKANESLQATRLFSQLQCSLIKVHLKGGVERAGARVSQHTSAYKHTESKQIKVSLTGHCVTIE